MKPNSVRQGATFAFEYELSGCDTDVFTANMALLQFPGDTPTVSRALSIENGLVSATLTSAETASLTLTKLSGRWFIHIRAFDSDEDLREPEPIDVKKGWITA